MLRKTLKATLLSFVCITMLSSAKIYAMPNEGAAQNAKIDIEITVGKLNKVDISDYVNEDDRISSFTLCEISDEKAKKISAVDIQYINGKLYLHPTSSGSIDYNISFQSGKTLELTGTASGIKQKEKKFNRLYSNVISAAGTPFAYEDINLSICYNSSGEVSNIYVQCGKVTNLSRYDNVTPDIKISFYDKNKKLLWTSQASKQPGSHINKTLDSMESMTYFVSGTDLPKKWYKNVKYWRIKDID